MAILEETKVLPAELVTYDLEEAKARVDCIPLEAQVLIKKMYFEGGLGSHKTDCKCITPQQHQEKACAVKVIYHGKEKLLFAQP
jgi:hypothetical protein